MKSVLLDTHVLLWAFNSPARLPRKAKALLEDESNEIHLSGASFWEMAIKVSLGKLTLPVTMGDFIQASVRELGVKIVFWGPEELEKLEKLPFHHRDPFDRMLVAQALTRQWSFVSKDDVFDRYNVKRIWN